MRSEVPHLKLFVFHVQTRQLNDVKAVDYLDLKGSRLGHSITKHHSMLVDLFHYWKSSQVDKHSTDHDHDLQGLSDKIWRKFDMQVIVVVFNERS